MVAYAFAKLGILLLAQKILGQIPSKETEKKVEDTLKRAVDVTEEGNMALQDIEKDYARHYTMADELKNELKVKAYELDGLYQGMIDTAEKILEANLQLQYKLNNYPMLVQDPDVIKNLGMLTVLSLTVKGVQEKKRRLVREMEMGLVKVEDSIKDAEHLFRVYGITLNETKMNFENLLKELKAAFQKNEKERQEREAEKNKNDRMYMSRIKDLEKSLKMCEDDKKKEGKEIEKLNKALTDCQRDLLTEKDKNSKLDRDKKELIDLNKKSKNALDKCMEELRKENESNRKKDYEKIVNDHEKITLNQLNNYNMILIDWCKKELEREKELNRKCEEEKQKATDDLMAKLKQEKVKSEVCEKSDKGEECRKELNEEKNLRQKCESERNKNDNIIKTLERKADNHRKKSEDCNGQLAEKINNINSLNKELNECQRELKEEKNKNQECNKEKQDCLYNDLHQLREKNDLYQKLMTESENNKECDTQKNNLMRDLETLKIMREQLENEKNQIMDKLNRNKKNKRCLEEKLKLKKKVADCQRDLTDESDKNKENKRTIEEGRNMITHLKNTLQNEERANQECQDNFKESQAEVQELLVQNGNLQKEVAESEENFKRSTHELNENRWKLNALEAEFNGYKNLLVQIQESAGIRELPSGPNCCIPGDILNIFKAVKGYKADVSNQIFSVVHGLFKGINEKFIKSK